MSQMPDQKRAKVTHPEPEEIKILRDGAESGVRVGQAATMLSGLFDRIERQRASGGFEQNESVGAHLLRSCDEFCEVLQRNDGIDVCEALAHTKLYEAIAQVAPCMEAMDVLFGHTFDHYNMEAWRMALFLTGVKKTKRYTSAVYALGDALSAYEDSDDEDSGEASLSAGERVEKALRVFAQVFDDDEFVTSVLAEQE